MFSVQSSTLADTRQASAGASVLVARQPILDREQRLYAYELLYRPSDSDRAGLGDGDLATASVITASFMDIGLDRMVEGRSAFINVTREFLLEGSGLALPPEQVVLEILEDVEVDADLVQAVRDLVRRGYRVALDDFAYDEQWLPLLELASVVKLDVLALSLEEVREHVQLLAAFSVELLAEKVETAEAYQALRDMGFHYFQGYFFARPNIVSGTRLPASKLSVLRLLGAVQDPDSDIDAIADLVSQDPGLSYRLMRFINSAFMGLPTKVTSIHRAVVYVGLAAVRRWVTLMAVASNDDKPSELTRMAVLRARMVERICAETGRTDAGVGFTVGLFSALDALMDRPLPELLSELPLSKEIPDALLEGSGDAGEALQCVIAYEQADWQRVEFHAMELPLERLAGIYAEAAEWASSVVAASRG